MKKSDKGFFRDGQRLFARCRPAIPDTCCRYRYRCSVALAAIVADPTSCSWCVQAELSHIRGAWRCVENLKCAPIPTILQPTHRLKALIILIYLYKYLYIK